MQCANCGGGHSANSNRCTLKHKAEKEAQRKKTPDKGKAKVVETNKERDKIYDEASFSPDMDLETEKEIKEEEEESSSQDKIPEGKDYTKDY